MIPTHGKPRGGAHLCTYRFKHLCLCNETLRLVAWWGTLDKSHIQICKFYSVSGLLLCIRNVSQTYVNTRTHTHTHTHRIENFRVYKYSFRHVCGTHLTCPSGTSKKPFADLWHLHGAFHEAHLFISGATHQKTHTIHCSVYSCSIRCTKHPVIGSVTAENWNFLVRWHWALPRTWCSFVDQTFSPVSFIAALTERQNLSVRVHRGELCVCVSRCALVFSGVHLRKLFVLFLLFRVCVSNFVLVPFLWHPNSIGFTQKRFIWFKWIPRVSKFNTKYDTYRRNISHKHKGTWLQTKVNIVTSNSNIPPWPDKAIVDNRQNITSKSRLLKLNRDKSGNHSPFSTG